MIFEVANLRAMKLPCAKEVRNVVGILGMSVESNIRACLDIILDGTEYEPDTEAMYTWNSEDYLTPLRLIIFAIIMKIKWLAWTDQ